MLFMILIVVVHPPVWSLFPIFAVGGSLHGIIMPSREKLVREASPKGTVGRSFGFVSTGISLGGVAAPVTMGLLLDTRQPELVFWALSGFMLIAVLTAFAQKRIAH
jgi:FSR family fosmidomycin resistance protein-like MFS transporter